MSSLHREHANLFCIIPILADVSEVLHVEAGSQYANNTIRAKVQMRCKARKQTECNQQGCHCTCKRAKQRNPLQATRRGVSGTQ
mmetsp:Transcript_40071/g.71654  ORF Transcript_40071/g.71654 Transcript_40071/m.71654 type:complete len:84 (+) Transcript_40071:231-482(+)